MKEKKGGANAKCEASRARKVANPPLNVGARHWSSGAILTTGNYF